MAHIAFDEIRWTELVENLEFPFVTPPSNHSSKPPPPIFNHDFSHFFKFVEIAIASCLKEVKTAYKKLARLLHPDTWNPYKPFTKEERSNKIKYVSNAYEALMESGILL